jgi:hypothetical protein
MAEQQLNTPRYAHHLGKVWAELEPMEKHEMRKSDRALYDALQADYAARLDERHERYQVFAQGRHERKLTPALEAYWAGRPVADLRQWLTIAPRVMS